LLLALCICFLEIRGDWSKSRTAGGWDEEEEEAAAIILVGVEGQLWKIEERGSMGRLNINILQPKLACNL